jgi:hypothetical protein
MLLRNILLFGAIFGLSFSVAQASIIVSTGGQGTGENVLFNSATLSGNTINATTNQGNAVTISGTENLAIPSSGQAAVTALDGTLSDLTWELTNQSLGYKLGVFNVNTHKGNDRNPNATAIIINVEDLNGTDYSQTWTIPNSGFFTIQADGNSLIGAVSFTVAEPAGSSIASVSQIRLEGVSAVPEASTWAMMILGFCGLSLIAYRKGKASVTLQVLRNRGQPGAQHSSIFLQS